jgi:hypothetical protein
MSSNEQIFNSYEEAHRYSLTIPWKIELCNTGESCWCRVIVPSEPIKFKEKISNWIREDITRDFDYIIPDGSVDKETAEYVVELHNRSVAIYAGQKERLQALQELNDLDQELGFN